MAQTTDHVPLSHGLVELSINGSSWTDMSPTFVRLPPTDNARKIDWTWTVDGDTPLLGAGKREGVLWTMDWVYTETDAEAYEMVRNQHEIADGGPIWFRYSPRGGNAGDERIESAEGRVVNFQFPPIDASAAGVKIVSVTIAVPYTTTTIIAS